MWDIRYLITDLFRSESFQEFINKRFKDRNKVVISKENINYVVLKNRDLFYMSDAIDCVNTIYQEYIFDDIRKDDIVIDIGATIGDFSIPASRMCDHVCAVEPNTTEELRKNISLNKRKNIQVIDAAFGRKGIIKTKWEYHGDKPMMSLSEIKNICGGCDFLKIDCEGCEWSIKQDELKGIRRIEMEVHKVGHPFSEMENMLREVGFNYKVDKRRSYIIGRWIVHAVNPDRD